MTCGYDPAPGLFDEPERVEGTEDTRTAGERLRARQLAAVAHGQHPLSVAFSAPIRLHPQARRDGDRTRDGSPRCGGCAHRRLVGGHARDYPKCLAGAQEKTRQASPLDRRLGRPELVAYTHWPRVTYGPGTDVRAWWPACTDFEPVLEEADRDD